MLNQGKAAEYGEMWSKMSTGDVLASVLESVRKGDTILPETGAALLEYQTYGIMRDVSGLTGRERKELKEQGYELSNINQFGQETPFTFQYGTVTKEAFTFAEVLELMASGQADINDLTEEGRAILLNYADVVGRNF